MAAYFERRIIPKCHDRLRKAKRALQLCRGARNFSEFESLWSEVLMHGGSVLNLLDAGSKLSPQGRQWYGGVKRAGRNDPLVSYMHQARNTEEHEGAPVSRHDPGSVSIKLPRFAGIEIDRLVIDDAFHRDPVAAIRAGVRMADGSPPIVIQTPAGPKLEPVVAPGPVTYRPPQEHLGRPLKDTGPLAVGALYVVYLEGLIEEAERMA